MMLKSLISNRTNIRADQKQRNESYSYLLRPTTEALVAITLIETS